MADYDTFTAMLTAAGISWTFDLKVDGTIEVDLTVGPGGPQVDGSESGFTTIFRFSGVTHQLKGVGIYE